MAGHSVNVCGVEVDFPFSPYPCQLVYMEKVISSLQQGTHAILESPTGTGKTLCLLCASLAWRESLIQRQRRGGGGEGGERKGDRWGEVEEEEDALWDSTPGGRRHSNIPKIIYASRTHSQLSQVIHELRNTRYQPRVAIIGSREQLCIHPEVSKKETNSEKVHLCRAKVQSNSCMFYRNVDVKRLRSREAVLDIEELVQAGSRQRMCPYYLAREMKSEADIVFMPYNYILDIKTRKMHGVDIQGTIIILDEAHNIERVCEESASFDLTSTDIGLCISDIDTILRAKKDEQSFSTEEDKVGEDLQDLLNLKAFFLAVERALDEVDIPDPSKGCVKPGQFIFDFLGGAGLTLATCPTLLDQCGKVISLLTSDSRAFRNGNNIQKFIDAVKVVFSQTELGDPRRSSHHYKVFLKREENKKKRSDVWTAPAEGSSKKENRTLSYWCFSPGRAMANLTAQGVRSVILTSGTLSPINSFSSELSINFHIQYEGPHIISRDQVWVGVVSKGCDGAVLNSSYKIRSTASYQTSLGNTIVNFSRIVPHGVLVFFPSYPVMHSCVDFWRENGILQRIEQHKPVLLEPRKKADFTATMDAFYDNIEDPKIEGAIFFAVCRGKVSEGLDFANNNGRAVIITGLPYPPRMDPKVELKMEYLTEARRRSRQAVVLGGQEWYRQQASRAVNQAIGRVIRHREDYGAILLCDERFAYPNTIDQLPKWVRPFVRTYDKFGLIQRDLTQFFRCAETKFGFATPKKARLPSQTSGGGGNGGSSSRGQIVVRDVSWRKEGVVDASVVETHLTSKHPGIPQASLTKLKDAEGKRRETKSLISSLESAEAGPSSCTGLQGHLVPQQGPTLSQSILMSKTVDLSTSSGQFTLSCPGTKPKKMLVISKRKKMESKVANITGFIDEIQSNLSDKAYASFKTALAQYKKKHDIYAFTESLKDIFKQPSLYHLLQGLHSFLQEEHRDTYSVFYHEFTGRHFISLSINQFSGMKRKTSCSATLPTHTQGMKQKVAKKMEDMECSSGGKLSHHLLRTDHLMDSSSHLNHGKDHLNA